MRSKGWLVGGQCPADSQFSTKKNFLPKSRKEISVNLAGKDYLDFKKSWM
jgi:hypothetical protein